MPRAYWKGYLRFSLVSIPVCLYSAGNSASRISLNQIHKPTMQRIRMQTMAGDQAVGRDEIVKGYEFEKDRYVLITEEELDKLRLPTDKTIEIEQFVEREDLDSIYLDSHYYLGPDGKVAQEAFAVMRDAIRESGKVGIGRVVLSGRERLVSVCERGKGLQLSTLRYADEFHTSEPYFADVPDAVTDEKKMQLAVQLIDGMTRPLDLTQFSDRYQLALKNLIQAKVEGQEPATLEEAAPLQISNLMDALERSLATARTGQAPAAAAATEPRKVEKKPPAKSVAAAGAKRGGKRKTA